MMKQLLTILFITAISLPVLSQVTDMDKTYDLKPQWNPEPFLYSVSTLTKDDLPWSLNYSGSYGERVVEHIGYNGIGQQFALKGYLGSRFTLYANAAIGLPHDGRTVSSQQVEVLRDFIGANKRQGLRLGFGLGGRRDFSNVKALLGRATLSYNARRWNLGGNMLFEKAFNSNRDAVDMITSIGCHYRLLNSFYVGMEALGEDLEGLWEEDEAEGGTKLLVGPSVSLLPNNSRFSFSFSGGPVLYATRSNMINPDAIRELPSQSGLALRAMVIFNLSKL